MNYGNSCVDPDKLRISRCDYDAAYELLEHIYGNLKVIYAAVYVSYTPAVKVGRTFLSKG